MSKDYSLDKKYGQTMNVSTPFRIEDYPVVHRILREDAIASVPEERQKDIVYGFKAYWGLTDKEI